MPTEQTISFTTSDTSDRTPPAVESVIPVDNSTDVSNNSLVIANLSEEIDVLSLTKNSYYVEEAGSGIRSEGSVAIEGKSLIFRPSKSYRLEEKHRVTLRGNLLDLAGNAMGRDQTYSFTTARLVTYTVGGTVNGLSGTLVLQNNGTNDTTLTTNGSFTFSSPVAKDRWRPTENDCGTGASPEYGAGTFQYCNADNNTCNSDASGNPQRNGYQ